MRHTTNAHHICAALIVAIIAVAYGAETFIASGWKSFKRSTNNTLTMGHATRTGHSDINLFDMIDSKLACGTDKSKSEDNEASSPGLSIWLAPYRQFPEVPEEGGDPRGKEDYEYFLYLTKHRCTGVASNYGSFKGSPADNTFKEASDLGLRDEVALAQRLGYDLFALDTRRSWTATRDFVLCQQYQTQCTLTHDGFIVVDLRYSDGLATHPDFLLNSTRMGIGLKLGEAIDAQSINPVRESNWHAWEYPKFGLAKRWNQSDPKSTSTDMPIVIAGTNAPPNLRTTIINNPVIKRLEIELICTQGGNKRVTVTTPANKDISELVSDCLPRSSSIISAVDQKGRDITQQAPQISKEDNRRSFYALIYSID